MKKLLLTLFILIIICGAVAAWIFLGPATGFSSSEKALYIKSNATTKKAVMDSLVKNKIITNETAFEFLANRLHYWKNIKPGKYEIKKGSSVLTVVRMLRNGSQTPVKFTINKVRTKEDLAEMVGRKFECDSIAMLNFLNSEDSLTKFQTSPELAVCNILPDSYAYFWNTYPSKIYQKFYDASQKFWTDERKQKAQALGLSPTQVYILASIIEEETTNDKEKDTIASVYLNRLNTGIKRLQADPTLKFAVKDFSLKRIAGDILNVESPYNTYKYPGLPPGPICTPSKKTIDAVLNPAKTNYMFFVANSNLNGHLFSVTFEEHIKKAAQYRGEDKLRRERDSVKNK
ncbi:MAG TPA: endolytic transglycosylase MltG [Flavisolibacter sp.]|nr:endolytic transglycosylase MltG [Flavisolibacter sp.]